ncbi:MAG: Ig domain-containing protein [Planctomycetota bacterium]|nr:Ig domain-containing protein [Planctomycetota bacterium]
MRTRLVIGCFVLLATWTPPAPGAVPAAPAQVSANPTAPAEFTITTTVVRPREKVPPIGANTWGRCGAVEWAANNFVRNSGNEPVYWRNLHRVKDCGPNWLEIDGPGTSWYDLWGNGFLSGADLRIYRLVDKDGKPLAPNARGDNIDAAAADRAVFVGKAQIIPAGTKDFPDGGWVANRYAVVYPNAMVRHGNLAATDNSGVENGRTYWYVVVALGAGDAESELSNEASAAPAAGADTLPHLLVVKDGDPALALKAGAAFDLAPKVCGGQSPLKWEAVDEQGKALALPEGLKLDAATGAISGRPAADVQDYRLRLKVTDAKGRSDVRAWVINPKPAAGAPAAPPPQPAKGAKGKAQPAAPSAEKPLPPEDVKAVAGDGCVTLSWKPSPSAGVVGYRIKRSVAPKAKQEMRVYVAAGAPAIEKFDSRVLEKRFGNFDMRYVNSRVRGIGNPMNAPGWYWSGDLAKLAFSFVPHPKPMPPEMVDPGETCMQVKADAGEQSISQTVFIGTNHGGESLWYGLLEPGKNYRLEVWLRQEGLADGGTVTFSYGKGYPDIRQTFKVTGEWKKYTHEFSGTPRPVDPWHFGHTFTFTGPGTLWMENCRIFRYDRPEDAQKLYVPGATVLEELIKSQPAAGPKAAHRIWFLARDATMSSILSWSANSEVRPDWSTRVSGTMDMTLPMGLEFDLRTGPDAASRMRPWLVLQHVLHSEQDWLNFIEYLAAPYDPKVDTPQAKPWAFKRYQQRGVPTPWTDEFACIIVEFGNETWHNGVFDDWLGFATRNAVHQGGREYGLFTRYLCENMLKSPYWKAQNLDKKIRFALGANYDGRIEKDGSVRGYGEEAMQANPYATILGHANYVGPKWETGEYSSRNYDDHGVQECLLSFLTGPEAGQIRMGQSRDALAKSSHEYDIAAYEGGPGGYALPGRAQGDQVETNEKYGKSLAQAVGALDAWMRSYLYGWTDQGFLGYGQGNHWNSHTPFADGFRPCPAWLALAMRNRYASGDLMAVEEKSVPTLARKDKALPLVGAYAMHDGARWSIFVVSRKLDGKHDGADFGDGSTPVTLRLPVAKAAKITLHKLTGDPRLTNRDKMNIAIQDQEVPAAALAGGVLAVNEQTGGVKGGLPPGSIFLYVVEAGK